MQRITKLTLKKYQTHFVVGAIGLILLLGFVWAGRPSTTADKTAVAGNRGLTASEQFYNFGTISMAAGQVKHSFTIRNDSRASVILKKLYTSCMCTTGILEVGGEKLGPFGMPGHGLIPTFSKTLKTEEEAVVEVTFDPAAHGPAGVGRISRVVYLETDAGKPLELKFNALVTP